MIAHVLLPCLAFNTFQAIMPFFQAKALFWLIREVVHWTCLKPLSQYCRHELIRGQVNYNKENDTFQQGSQVLEELLQ